MPEKTIAQDLKDRTIELAKKNKKILNDLGIRGTHFQNAFPEFIYAVRVAIKTAKGDSKFQRFVNEKILPIEYQFAGSYPLLKSHNVINDVAENYEEFMRRFSSIISKGTHDLDFGILRTIIRNGNAYYSEFREPDQEMIKTVLGLRL